MLIAMLIELDSTTCMRGLMASAVLAASSTILALLLTCIWHMRVVIHQPPTEEIDIIEIMDSPPPTKHHYEATTSPCSPIMRPRRAGSRRVKPHRDMPH